MSEDFQSQFEQYWTNCMSASSREQFEERIRADKEFARQVRLYIKAMASIELKAKEKLKEELLEFGNELLDEESVKPSSFP